MFIVLLKFSDNRQQAGQFMDGHNAWLKQGFDDDIFILAGSLGGGMGGGILAHNCNIEDLTTLVSRDPFVENQVVLPEIIELSPAKAISKMDFLLQ